MGNGLTASFRVTDPEFPFIAANAALEVDNLINGRRGEVPNLKKLSELLKNAAFRTEQSTKQLKNIMDPVSVDVFQRALFESHNCHLASIQDLAAKAAEVASELESAPTKEDMLDIIKRFCLELSRLSLATRYTMQQSRSENPFKK